MSYKPISLRNLIAQKNHVLFLPHIQRPFVWETDQIIKLMDSLLRNYPIQTLLFWKTKEHIKTRRFMDNIEFDPDLSDYYDYNISQEGKEKTFVLDGQQRLQSLFAVFDGYIENKELYLNLLTGDYEIEDGLYYEFKLSGDEIDLPYFKIKKLVHDNRNAEEISEELNEKLDEILVNEENSKNRQKLVRRNISQLISLIREDKHFWYDELDGIANNYTYNMILNIFIRVNSGGTKLDAADLMFAAMKEKWEDVEENIENIVDVLNNSGWLKFDKTFVLKCIMLMIDKGSVLSPDLFQSAEGEKNLSEIEKNWVKISDAFSQLRDFVHNDLMLYSDKVIRSYNSFIPIVEYFYFYPNPDPINRAKLKSYYYKSQLFNWYSARTDQLLNVIHGILKNTLNNDFPLNDISDYFKSLGKDVVFTKDHLLNSRLRFIFLNLLYVNTHNTSPFNVAYKHNEPHVDHIYPKSKLKHLNSTEVNHIGNYRLVGASDNVRKRAELPASYFLRLNEEGLDIKRHLLIDEYSNNPRSLTIDNYIDFKDKRLSAIFDICKRVINM
ncbi:DUF262 domain-containing protein [Brevibacillus reuszeri]|uniref:GmrSD restriction endonuclease domain-containing protein n=1 Tax=Brevibacillus reuszeri TaxID=54915 RepID=UPI00366EE418